MHFVAAINFILEKERIPDAVREALSQYLNCGSPERIPPDAVCCFRDSEGWVAVRRSAEGDAGPAIGHGTSIQSSAENLVEREAVYKIAREESRNPATEQKIREAVESLLMDKNFMQEFVRAFKVDYARYG